MTQVDEIGSEDDRGDGGLVVPNGVDADSGRYGEPMLTMETWARHVLGSASESDIGAVRRWARKLTIGTHEVVDGRSENRLDQSGWGVIFSERTDARVRDELAELLELRRAQSTTLEPLYHEFSGSDGIRAGESKQDFLARHGAGAGAVDPRKMPYHLLLVGSPEEIPFSVQYQLDVRHGVGRIHFDHLDDYRHYARAVVAAESRTARRAGPRRLSLFGPRNPDDWVTEQMSHWLVRQLGDQLGGRHPDDWRIDVFAGEQATKQRLVELIGGTSTPDVVLSASHGVFYRAGHPLQRDRQGALLCQEWAGPLRSHGMLSTDCFVAAEDIGADAALGGLIAFFFSCFGAATSRWDETDPVPHSQRAPRAPATFLSRLPSHLLSRPAGAALAVVAHVDQAFPQYNGEAQEKTFGDLLRRLMEGATIGWALEVLNRRYAELASDLHELRERRGKRLGGMAKPEAIFELWRATNDSRGFVVLGDPAVRVPGVEVAGP